VKNYWEIRELFDDVKYWRTDSSKDLANKVDLIRTFTCNFLKALEKQGFVMSKKIESVKVYFKGDR
jgi:hypothetical protein